jgi:hypothetical protein
MQVNFEYMQEGSRTNYMQLLVPMIHDVRLTFIDDRGILAIFNLLVTLLHHRCNR